MPTPLATVALTNSVTFGVYGLASRWDLSKSSHIFLNHICVFFFPRQWGNDGVVDAGRNGLCAGLVRSLVIRYCRSLCVAPGLRVISAPSRWSRFNNRWQFRWFGVRWQSQWLTKVRCQVRPQLSVKEVASKVWRITSPSSLWSSALSIISTIIFVIMLLPWHHGHVCVICIFGHWNSH